MRSVPTAGRLWNIRPFVGSILALFVAAEVYAGDTLRLATGSTGGIYDLVGHEIALVADKEGLTIQPLGSSGSIENLRLLHAREAEFAFSQSDIAHDAYHGIGAFTSPMPEIRVLASLYTEAVHVVVRNPLYIRRLEDMRGKRIFVGPAGSGTEANALTLLEAAGLTPGEFTAVRADFADGIAALRNKTADVAFVTSGTPSEIVSGMLQGDAGHLFEFPVRFLRRLIERNPSFVSVTIRENTYPFAGQDIRTVGVAALLMTRRDLDSALAYRMTRLLFSREGFLVNRDVAGRGVSVASERRGSTTRTARGAQSYFREQHWYLWATRDGRLWGILEVSLYLLMGLILLSYVGRITLLQKKKMTKVVILLVILWFANTGLLHWFDGRVNEDYSSLFGSFWPALMSLISFGSKEPLTTMARTTATITSILWIAGITWLTAQLVASFVEERKRRKKPMEDHFVIINWSAKAGEIVTQLASADLAQETHRLLPRMPWERVEPKTPDITVISDSDDARYLYEKENPDIYLLKGDPSEESVLEAAGVHRARSVVILAQSSHSDEQGALADARTILILLKIVNLCKKPLIRNFTRRQLPVIVEIVDPRHIKAAKGLMNEDVVDIEVVSMQHLGGRLLSQAVASPGVNKLYEDLLSFDQDDNGEGNSREIYREVIPERLKNHSFRKLLDLALASDFNLMPIAVSDHRKVVITPTSDEGVEDNLSRYTHYFAIAPKADQLQGFNRHVDSQKNL